MEALFVFEDTSAGIAVEDGAGAACHVDRSARLTVSGTSRHGHFCDLSTKGDDTDWEDSRLS